MICKNYCSNPKYYACDLIVFYNLATDEPMDNLYH